MDSDDDFLSQSVFEETIKKGDLVWAPLKLDSNQEEDIFWPAQVTSIKSSDVTGVKMLGRPASKVVKVSGCLPYVANQEFQDKYSHIEHWETAMSEVNRILEMEDNSIIKTKLITCTSASPSSHNGNKRKRRKIENLHQNGFIQGDIVWAKYRSHPIWPAQVTALEKKDLMIKFFECGDVSIKTALKNVFAFNSAEYENFIETGINSPMSASFKMAYKHAFDLYQRDETNDPVKLIPVNCNGSTSEPVPVSPQKGKNQLVRFINRSQAIFNKIAQGKLVAHYHTNFMANQKEEQGTLFGSYAKTDLEEFQIVTAIGHIQSNLPKRLKLPPEYGISVILPESIIRMIMQKKQLSYAKAKEEYQAEINKVKKKDKLSALKALLDTPIEEERKQQHAEVSNHHVQQCLRGRRRRR